MDIYNIQLNKQDENAKGYAGDPNSYNGTLRFSNSGGWQNQDGYNNYNYKQDNYKYNNYHNNYH